MGTPPAQPDRAPARPSRGVLVFGIFVAAIVAILLAVWVGFDATSAGGASAGSEPAASAPQGEATSASRPARGAARAVGDAGPAEARATQASATDPAARSPETGYRGVPLELGPPPTPGSPEVVVSPQPEPAPVRTQESFIEAREAGLRLLDATRERLEREAGERERTGDAEGARRTRLRLSRLATVRAQREQELEQARRGELVPEPQADSPPEHEPHEEHEGP